MKKYLTFLLFALIACNCTSFKRGEKVSLFIEGEFKKCYCTVKDIRINQIVILRCDDGSKYRVEAANLIKCGSEKDYDLE